MLRQGRLHPTGFKSRGLALRPNAKPTQRSMSPHSPAAEVIIAIVVVVVVVVVVVIIIIIIIIIIVTIIIMIMITIIIIIVTIAVVIIIVLIILINGNTNSSNSNNSKTNLPGSSCGHFDIPFASIVLRTAGASVCSMRKPGHGGIWPTNTRKLKQCKQTHKEKTRNNEKT